MINDEFWKNKKVLVTGHTGFKGSWLTLWLINLGAKVYGYGLEPNHPSDLFNLLNKNLKDKLNSKISNILDKENFHNYIKGIQPDIIFHLAAQPLVIESYKEPIKTWETNVIGTLNLLEAAKNNLKKCGIVCITTDKVYENKEWVHGYRENDILGGNDPYSASKAASEIAISSWRKSFCGEGKKQIKNLYIASARAGNVIGGGDWANFRLLPDCIRSLMKDEEIILRNPQSTRPWQHVLEPLGGYLILAEKLMSGKKIYQNSFNFGPYIESNKSVLSFVKEVFKSWPGEYKIEKNILDYKESNLLYLNIEKSRLCLNWSPMWDFKETIYKSVSWYKNVYCNKKSAYDCCLEDLSEYNKSSLNKYSNEQIL